MIWLHLGAQYICGATTMASIHGNTALEEIGRETVRLVQAGGYETASGGRVDIARATAAAVAGTRTFGSDELDELLDRKASSPASGAEAKLPRIEVSAETTQEATHRLCVREAIANVAILNFASAVNAGGGFLYGAIAQEEDLARCSALYACLETQPDFYASHRNADSHFYSDRMIYSPRVPFFRVRSEELLDHCYEASVLTVAAPNATKILAVERDALARIEATFRRRTGKLLALAEAKGHRALVLGAWGCGVFGNDPVMAADSFGAWLESARFRGSFDSVVFAVYDRRPGQPTHAAFHQRLHDAPRADQPRAGT